MTQLIYIPVVICLIILQTTILPFFFHVTESYDTVILFILYLGLYRSIWEGLPILLVVGILMDCLSGGPFGIYTTTYIWLYAAIRATIQFLHVNSLIVLPVTIVTGVILENLVVFLTVLMGRSDVSFSYNAVKTVLAQVLWAVVTGPVIFSAIKTLHHGFERWFKMNMSREKKQSDFKH